MGKESRAKYLAKNTFIFALGNFGTKIINFFLVPIYTYVLNSAQYGTVDLITTITTVLAPVLILNISESVMRYSLDKDGLVYAGGEFDPSKYKKFKADEDNIIPITDDSYLKDDIVEKFKEFVKVVYGEETLDDNLDFIADSIGRKNAELAEETIRRYFINDFYKDHVQIYKKKPIYWLFDSGKKNGFKSLIYMHRYNENIVGKMRLDYLYKIQRIYETRLTEIQKLLTNPEELSNYELKNFEKEQHSLNDKLVEIKEYNEKLSSIGDKKIKIDLDDGVSVNYSKFTYIDPITNKESNILANAKDIVPKKKNKE